MRGPRLQFRFNNQKELNCIIALLNLLGFHNRRNNPLLMFQGNTFQEGLSIFCNYSDEHPFGYIGITSNYDQNYYLTLDDLKKVFLEVYNKNYRFEFFELYTRLDINGNPCITLDDNTEIVFYSNEVKIQCIDGDVDPFLDVEYEDNRDLAKLIIHYHRFYNVILKTTYEKLEELLNENIPIIRKN